MPPQMSCVSSQLRQLIHYHIDNNLLQNALFFSERLAAYDLKSSENAYLLSLCHLRLGDNSSAYEYSKLGAHKGAHLGCAYVFAQACLALDKYKDGIMVLEKSRGLWSGKNNFGKHTPTTRQPYADAAAVNCLLGKLYHGYDDKQRAISCFQEALKINPLMWDAFTSLCDMGANIRVSSLFKMNPEMEAVLRVSVQEQVEPQQQARDVVSTSVSDHDRSRPGPRPVSIATDPGDPFNITQPRSFTGGLFSQLGMSQKLNESNPSLTNLPATVNEMDSPAGSSASMDASIVPSRNQPGVVSAYPSEPPQAPVRKSRTLLTQGLGMDFSMDAPKISRGLTSKRGPRPIEPAEESAATQAVRGANLGAMAGERKRTISGQVVPRQTSEDPGAPQRRSVRLFNQIRPTKAGTTAPPSVGPAPGRELKKARPPISRIMRPNSTTSTVGRQVSGNRKPVPEDQMDVDQRDASVRPYHSATSIPTQRSSETDAVKQEEALNYLLTLIRQFGQGYFALAQFQCQEAFRLFNNLPRAQQETPWVMSQMGRALYEQADYPAAEKYYRRIRQVAPTRFEDMEIYSTILWHLKRETDLAFLAHELIDASWQSPEAWCVLGNSWALARDHEQALKCFKRATQLNPRFAYAFTLQGHEHVANEEYDKALISYRQGMAADKRHYNAWYGVGKVYEKLGNYEKAFAHFSSASLINPTNTILICSIGSILEKQKQHRQASSYFARATEMDPKSHMARYGKARSLMAIGDNKGALKDLMILKDIAPDAAMVHFLLGRLYKGLRDKGAAVRHFTIALNLDPKVNFIPSCSPHY
jgi:anaphase-promoting complex subunit 3